MRVLRDSDSVSQSYKKNEVSSTQTFGLARTVLMLDREIKKIKRRPSGGAGITTSTGMTYKGEYDSGTQYDVQQIVTRGVIGEFICVQQPPIGTAPETGAPYWHALQYPPPGQWM